MKTQKKNPKGLLTKIQLQRVHPVEIESSRKDRLSRNSTSRSSSQELSKATRGSLKFLSLPSKCRFDQKPKARRPKTTNESSTKKKRSKNKMQIRVTAKNHLKKPKADRRHSVSLSGVLITPSVQAGSIRNFLTRL